MTGERAAGSGEHTTMMGEHIAGTYRLADTVVRIESLYPDVHKLCWEYSCGGAPDFSVSISQQDIDFERQRSDTVDASNDPVSRPSSDGYLETLAVYRKIAEAMPARSALLMHGSCVAVDGVAYLFCAPSGTGKSTHTRLWRELLGERAVMVNDDKPIVRVSEHAIVYGTPWDGKHHLSSDIEVPLRAICLLERDTSNHIVRVDAAKSRIELLQHVYRPLDPEALALTLSLVDQLFERVDVWRLGCTMDVEAAQISYTAMSGA